MKQQLGRLELSEDICTLKTHQRGGVLTTLFLFIFGVFWISMAAPTFKSFVSEKEIEEVKKKRQEEWEKVRRPDQPLGEILRI